MKTLEIFLEEAGKNTTTDECPKCERELASDRYCSHCDHYVDKKGNVHYPSEDIKEAQTIGGALNNTHKQFVDPLNESKQHTWSSYGQAVQKLVSKYQKHNVSDSSTSAAPNTSVFRASQSGKIEYAPHHDYSYGYQNMHRGRMHHAVKIGSAYPRDKAKDFKDEYAKIIPPEHVTVQDAGLHTVKPVSDSGTNYSTYGLRIDKAKDNLKEGVVGTIVKRTAQGAAATGGAEAADTVVKDYRAGVSTGNALATRAVQNVAELPKVAAKVPRLAKYTSTAAEITGLGKGLLGKAAWPVTAGMAFYDAFKGYNAQPNAPTTTRIRNAGQNALSGVTFGIVPPPPGIKEEKVGKTLKQFREETINEEHDVELEPHPDKPGTHYRVRKISKKSGIKGDQLKAGETLNDTHVDDLKDMGYSVKIHNG